MSARAAPSKRQGLRLVVRAHPGGVVHDGVRGVPPMCATLGLACVGSGERDGAGAGTRCAGLVVCYLLPPLLWWCLMWPERVRAQPGSWGHHYPRESKQAHKRQSRQYHLSMCLSPPPPP
eukprot:scaffold125680_cov36-Tisochrysis_lutea.AAC.3